MIARIFLAIALIVITLSCDSENNCTEKMTCEINLSFAAGNIVDGKWTIVPNISFRNIKINGLQRPDSILYDSLKVEEKNVRKISLPLSPQNDVSKFIFVIENSYKDTLNVKYQTKNVFVNYDCGFRSEFAIDTVWFSIHSKDTIKISQPYVSTSLHENGKIIFSNVVVSKP